MINSNDKIWHGRYEALNKNIRAVIDDAFVAVQTELKNAGFEVMGDDRAEALVAAITRYLIESAE